MADDIADGMSDTELVFDVVKYLYSADLVCQLQHVVDKL